MTFIFTSDSFCTNKKPSMTHEQLVAKRKAIQEKGNWDSTKPFDGPKYTVVKTPKGQK